MNIKTILSLFLLFTGNFIFAQKSGQLKTGDIIFQTSLSPTATAIKLATHSKFSHVGLVINKNGKLFVLEAVQPVSITPLDQFIHRGQNSYYEVKRLKNADEKITPALIQQLLQQSDKIKGLNYDLAFNWSDEEWYCSELVYKMYKNVFKIELAQPKALKTFDLSNPAVKQQLDVKYGKQIPYNELMISPQQLYESSLLVDVK